MRHYYFMCHYERKKWYHINCNAIPSYHITAGQFWSQGCSKVYLRVDEMQYHSSPTHRHSCTIPHRPLNAPDLFLQLKQCVGLLWFASLVRFLYTVKILWSKISGFLPELRYSGALRSFQLWGAGALSWFCSLESLRCLQAFLAPSCQLLEWGLQQWKGSHLPQPPPRSHPHLHSGMVPTCFGLLPTSWSLVSQARRERCRKEDFLASNQDSGNGCLGNQVLTGSNSYSLFLLD